MAYAGVARHGNYSAAHGVVSFNLRPATGLAWRRHDLGRRPDQEFRQSVLEVTSGSFSGRFGLAFPRSVGDKYWFLCYDILAYHIIADKMKS